MLNVKHSARPDQIDRDRELMGELNPAKRTLVQQAPIVRRLEQTRPQCSMNFYCAADDRVDQRTPNGRRHPARVSKAWAKAAGSCTARTLGEVTAITSTSAENANCRFFKPWSSWRLSGVARRAGRQLGSQDKLHDLHNSNRQRQLSQRATVSTSTRTA